MESKLTRARKHILFGCICSIMLLLSCLTFYTYSWFTINHDSFVEDLKGSSMAKYFESGTGTSTDPYIISNSKHVYNLS